MSTKRILVVGGYGAVGLAVCELVARREDVTVVLGGRRAEAAKRAAERLGTEAATVDIDDAASVQAAIEDADLVINCCIPTEKPSTHVPRRVAETGKAYLDVAAVPTSFVDAVLALDPVARKNGATLVTGLGCNPGIPGVVAKWLVEQEPRTKSVQIYFTLGSRLAGLSALSMQGVALMMQAPAEQWSAGRWQKPRRTSTSRRVEHFGRTICFGPGMITRDLRDLPRELALDELAFWSGVQHLVQGMAFMAGVKLGRGATHRRAEGFVRFLRRLAGRDAAEEAVLEHHARDAKGVLLRQASLCCSEELATAAAPAAVCFQWLDGELEKPGAFLPPQAVPSASFVSHLGRLPVGWQVS